MIDDQSDPKQMMFIIDRGSGNIVLQDERSLASYEIA
jgi:hypothetical protein